MSPNGAVQKMALHSNILFCAVCTAQIFMPAVSVVAAAFLQCLPLSGKSRRRIAHLLIFSLAFLLAILNAGKEPSSDLLTYKSIFDQMKSLPLLGVFSIAYGFEREPIFWILLYSMSGFDFSTFLFCFTFAAYFVAFLAINEIGKQSNSDYLVITSVMLFVGLFYINFSLSAHLMRQFLASSLLVLAIIAYAKRQTFRLISLLIVGVLTHNMIFALIPSFVLASFSLTNKQRSIKIIVLAAFSVLLAFYSGVFDKQVQYILHRIQGSNQDLGRIGLGYVSFAICTCLVAFGVGRGRKSQFFELLRYIILTLTVIIITGTLLPTFNDMAARFFSLLLFLFPLVFFMLPKKLVKQSFPLLAPVLLVTFFYNLYLGEWVYQSATVRALFGSLWMSFI